MKSIYDVRKFVIVTAIIMPLLCSVAAAGEPAPPPASPQAVEGAFSSLMGESFRTDLATGAATLGIPVVVPPGRKNVQPNIMLSYSSSNPNGICGVGWTLPVAAMQRSTKKGVPRYNIMEDITAGSDELVSVGVNEYRAKIESSFTKYAYVSAENKWIACDKAGTQYHFGSSDSSRMSNPANPNYIFAWYIDKVTDVYGNAIAYSYIKEDAAVYLKYIDYTSNSGSSPALSADKKVEFVYEPAERPDKIYSNRTGWPSVIRRRLQKIIISVDSNKDGAYSAGDIVWIYNLSYILSADTSRSLLQSVQLEDGAGNKLPAKTFTYQSLE